MAKNYWEWEPAFELVPEETALIVVDMQNGFLEEDSPLFTPMAKEQVPTIAELISFCREKGIPVIFSEFTVGEDFHYDFYWRMAEQRGLKLERPECQFWAGKHETAVTDDLKPLEGEKVLSKTGYDCFAKTDLDEYLRSKGIKTLIISGTVVNWCVDSTARTAYHKDYNVVIPSDTVSAYDHAGATAEQWVNMELNFFAEALGRVMPAKQVMEELSK